MRKFLRTYTPFSKYIIKQNYFAYKSRFLLWTISNIVLILAQIFLYIALFSNSNTLEINGYTKNEMIQYIIYSKIIESFSFVSVEQQLGNDIRDGSIVNSLIKPINYKIELLFRSIGGAVGSTLLFSPFYFIILLIFNYEFIFSIKFVNILIFILFVIIAFILNFFISMIFASIIFNTIKYNGIYEVKKTIIKLFSGALFPLSFYPPILQTLLKYLPFTYLRYIPVCIIQGKFDFQTLPLQFLIALFWIFVLYLASFFSFKLQIKKISIFGG